MAGNQVTLTFAGDSERLERSFAAVGESADRMGRSVRDAGDRFDTTAESFDTADTRAMGFRDTVTGVQDSMAGFKAIAAGDIGFTSLLTAGAGVGDLASGFSNLLVPAAKGAVTWLKESKVATLAVSAAQKIAAAGTAIWTGAQTLLNAAFITSPIGWIVLGIAALVAVVVLIATKTTWFQDAWRVTWAAVKAAAEWVANAVVGYLSWIGDNYATVWNGIKSVADWVSNALVSYMKWVGDNYATVFRWIKTAAGAAWDFLTGLPGKLGNAFSAVYGFITAPFRSAFNFVSDAWNNTVGRMSWTVPSWVPGIGGRSFSAPHLPKFHDGGVVPGAPGSELLAILQAGETVTPAGGSPGGQLVVTIAPGSDDRLTRELLKMLSFAGRTGLA